jgi:uncharacterized membrane protein
LKSNPAKDKASSIWQCNLFCKMCLLWKNIKFLSNLNQHKVFKQPSRKLNRVGKNKI